ncbi:hypothetical protein CROQUDRAFT_402416 [Cronartium quercuum f. sp. fusiforme G11]|uniref:Uncharacterized protein n=1 Tax=Cronartium quercuum f. sp. fusiforme G11 TaxID=708437 RepID=A0A9P6NWV9_9BASI|nr:hypothetical protein CROQUDRAFT_402416 [Cronartium quercuum f. sp. fusiforme G11]
MYHHLSPRQLLPALAGALFPNQAQGQADRTSVAASEPVVSPAAPTVAATQAPTEASVPTKAPVSTQAPTNTVAESVVTATPASTPLPTSLPSTSTITSSSSAPVTSTISGPPLTSTGKPQTSSIIYVTITATGRDGNVYTSVSSHASAIPMATGLSGSSGSGGGGSPSGSTWAIIGGVVGGLAALAAVIFIVFRCTQRRFSELDDEDVAIKWPELVNRADDSSTLNPLAARQAAGHGVGDDGEEEKPGMSPGQGPYSDTLHRGDTVQSTLYSNGSYGAGPGAYGEHPGYCKLI